MTNAEKFKEVFGFYPDTDTYMYSCPEYLEHCRYCDLDGCHCDDWWKEEYKGGKE